MGQNGYKKPLVVLREGVTLVIPNAVVLRSCQEAARKLGLRLNHLGRARYRVEVVNDGRR